MGYGDFLARFLYGDGRAAAHLLPLAVNTFLGFYYVVCESVLEGIGQQRRSAFLAVTATASGVLLTLLLGVGFRMGINAFLIGELASSTFGVLVSLLWVKRCTGLQLRLGNWLLRPMLAVGLAYGPVRPLFPLLCAGGVWEPLAFAFCISLTALLYSILLRLLGLDYGKYLRSVRS